VALLSATLLVLTTHVAQARDVGDDPVPVVNQDDTQDQVVEAVVEPEAPVGVWDRLAMCESHGNWATNTGNGYFGGIQFDLRTWRAYGGVGLPSAASRSVQIAVAERLRAARGYQPWPVCSRVVGLR
jgi:hypothetical protein